MHSQVDLLTLIGHLNLAHDRMLYARDYFQNRMKNFPDNELGKTLSSIEEINKALEICHRLSKFHTLMPIVENILTESNKCEHTIVSAKCEGKRIWICIKCHKEVCALVEEDKRDKLTAILFDYINADCKLYHLVKYADCETLAKTIIAKESQWQ